MKKKSIELITCMLVSTLFFLVSCAPSEEDTPTPVTNYKLSQASLFTEPSSSIVEYTGSGKVTNSGTKTSLSLIGSYQKTATTIVGFEGRNTKTGTTSLIMKLNDGTTITSNNTEVLEISGDDLYALTVTGDDELIYAVESYAGISGGKISPYQYAIKNNGGFATYSIQACGSIIGECPSPTTVANHQYTFTMMGTEYINVDGANYESYKIKSIQKVLSNHSAFEAYEANSTVWYYPKLGVLKAEETATFESGSIVELSYKAKSHNFGKP